MSRKSSRISKLSSEINAFSATWPSHESWIMNGRNSALWLSRLVTVWLCLTTIVRTWQRWKGPGVNQQSRFPPITSSCGLSNCKANVDQYEQRAEGDMRCLTSPIREGSPNAFRVAGGAVFFGAKKGYHKTWRAMRIFMWKLNIKSVIIKSWVRAL